MRMLRNNSKLNIYISAKQRLYALLTMKKRSDVNRRFADGPIETRNQMLAGCLLHQYYKLAQRAKPCIGVSPQSET